MNRARQTIKSRVEYEGRGLFSGEPVKLTFLPAAANTGIVFVRVDLSGKPRIPATPEFVNLKFRRTALVKDGVTIETVEHLMAAMGGLGIDDLEVHINGGEVPCGDGSAAEFVEVLSKAGMEKLEAPCRKLSLRESVSISEEGATLIALPQADGLSISYTLQYNCRLVGSQYKSLRVTPETFRREIAAARTFCLASEVNTFLEQGLGKGATYENTLVVDEERGIIENEVRFVDEFVRHKILDLIGDLALLNAELNAHIVAIKSGHAANLRLVRKLFQMLREEQRKAERPQTILDVRELMKVLPHRYPFLLIDKVIEIDGYRRAVGIKNVTFNEPYFQGHFPGTPIMPGVLQIEAMAQLAGALLLRKAENVNKLAVLMSLDKVKLRKTVVPGDQLRIEAEAIRVKSRTGLVYTRATVEGKLVSEAYMKFMIVDG